MFTVQNYGNVEYICDNWLLLHQYLAKNDILMCSSISEWYCRNEIIFVISPYHIIECVLAVTHKNVQISSSQPIPTFLPTSHGIGTIFCKGHWINSNVQKSLYDNTLHQKLLHYLSSKLQVPSSILQK